MWRCELRSCTGCVFIKYNVFVESKTCHNHAADSVTNIKTAVLNKLKKTALEKNDRAMDLVVDILKDKNDNTISILPKVKYIRDRITRIRKIEENYIKGEIYDFPANLRFNLQNEIFSNLIVV
jgi:hypothetical protein